jgi:ParB-like chromosome segregation protein Spo0J
MKIESIKLEKLIPYAKNSRTHDDFQIQQIAASIREFGFTNPVLIDSEDGIIAGHGRVMAARKLGLTEVPCIRLGHLTETQKKAYIIADNRIAEVGGGWDEEMLGLELADLREADFDLDLIGFDAGEIEAALNPAEPIQSDSDDGERIQDVKEPIECPHCHMHFAP